MTVYLLIREDQNDHGFVDTGVVGVFGKKEDAEACLLAEAQSERESGSRVEGETGPAAGDWDVALRVEEYEVL